MPTRGKQLIKRKVTTTESGKPVNCWQFMSCGREPGGLHAARLGVCPAATVKRLDGVHGGKNAGRACWVIAGSLPGEDSGCVTGAGMKHCAKCDFYCAVKSEEGKYIWPDAFLLRFLKK